MEPPDAAHGGPSALTEAVGKLHARLSETAPDSLYCTTNLAARTSFQIGGPADLLLDPPSVEVLSQALAAARELSVPVTYLGGGTNVLISDAGIRGLVVRLGKAFDFRRWSEDEGGRARLEVGAATRFISLSRDTVARGYGGLEFAAGIPGSVGGAVRMNAGAFGGEIADVLLLLEGVDADGRILRIPRADLQFSYRRLALDPAVMVTSIHFGVVRSPAGKLRAAVEKAQRKRRTGQPVGYPNAGSIFKNPPGEYAGRLIERAGLKGSRVGGAAVSMEHANFIVNTGEARAVDVHNLMGIVQEAVWKKCGVWLEPEVRLVGDWE